jgi:hypothetical protein
MIDINPNSSVPEAVRSISPSDETHDQKKGGDQDDSQEDLEEKELREKISIIVQNKNILSTLDLLIKAFDLKSAYTDMKKQDDVIGAALKILGVAQKDKDKAAFLKLMPEEIKKLLKASLTISLKSNSFKSISKKDQTNLLNYNFVEKLLFKK